MQKRLLDEPTRPAEFAAADAGRGAEEEQDIRQSKSHKQQAWEDASLMFALMLPM